MKMRLFAAVIILCTLPVISQAAPAKQGGYFSGFLGFNETSDSTLKRTDFSSTPYSIHDDSLEFDSGIYTGGTGGYDFGMFRLEGELSYRNADIKKVNMDRGLNRSLDILSLMFNAYFDLENPSPVTPYVGGGVGLVSMGFDDDYYERSSGNPVFYEDTSSTHAFQAAAGLEFAITPRFSLDLGYRFFKTGTATFDSEWDLENKLKIQNHNVALGFRAKF